MQLIMNVNQLFCMLIDHFKIKMFIVVTLLHFIYKLIQYIYVTSNISIRNNLYLERILYYKLHNMLNIYNINNITCIIVTTFNECELF